jgi:short-subunit dehydrogenase
MARAFARLLASQQTDLILSARRPEELEADAADLRIRHGVIVDCMQVDVLSEKSRKSFFAGLPDRIDLIASFVGYLGDQGVAEHNAGEASRIIETNYSGVAMLLEHAALYLEKQKGEHRAIIGVSSVAGDRGRQSNYLYGSAKAGLTAYLSGLRNRLFSQGIHVLTVKPGFVRTGMTAGMSLPGALTAAPEQTARDIYGAVIRRKNVLYTLWMWRWIMCIIRSIPESLFKRLRL